MSEPRRVLLVTYTFGNPLAAGVFFRAIRLATEFCNRGWSCVILNLGPLVKDPKVESPGPHITLRNDVETGDVWKALRQFREVDPDLVIFGEAPFAGAMKMLWGAAAMLGKPFILLEQYYGIGTPGYRFDVDMILLYGLKCFWELHANKRKRWTIISPFIGEVTPAASLPAPPSAPRVLILGGETIVLNEGIELMAGLLAGLEGEFPQVVTVSREPTMAAQQMAEAGIPATHAVALPLQSDATLFGLMQSSAAAIMANGFMQMTESLALGCPAVLIDRGLGMWPGQVNEVFEPYVSFAREKEEHRQALRGWLRQSPFDARLQERLQQERNGAIECAAHIERLLANPPVWRMKWRQAAYRARLIRKTIGSRFQPHLAATR